MEIILDCLSPKEFFSNGGVVKIRLESDVLKKMFKKRDKFLFYEYKAYIRFLRELYLRYMTAYPDLSSQDIYKKVNDEIEMSCHIGTKEYTIDPNFDGVCSLEFSNFYYCYDNDPLMKNQRNNRIDVFGIKNVNFSMIDIDDSRWDVFEKQRLNRGFDDSELWNLHITLAGFILPRLKAFKENICSSPTDMTIEEWKEILEKMIVAFEILAEDKEYSIEEEKKIGTGLNLFVKYFRGLWN